MEKTTTKGRYTIESYNIKTKECKVLVFENAITQQYFSAIHAFLNQSISAPDIDSMNLTHIAIGTGTATASRSDTSLSSEYFRKQLTAKSFSATKFTAKVSIDVTEGNVPGEYIKEVGIFAQATDTPGSGILFSRANVNIQKNDNIRLNISWELVQS